MEGREAGALSRGPLPLASSAHPEAGGSPLHSQGVGWPNPVAARSLTHSANTGGLVGAGQCPSCEDAELSRSPASGRSLLRGRQTASDLRG